MSEDNRDDIPAFAILAANNISYVPADSAEHAQSLALQRASITKEDFIAVQVIGHTFRTPSPVQWSQKVVSTPPPTSEPIPLQTQLPTTTPIPSPAAPPLNSVAASQYAIKPLPTPLPQVEVESSNRVKTKYPSIRGVAFPTYCDIIAADGPDGPPTQEQMTAANAEITRLGGSLAKTVKGWTGAEVNGINSATMDAVIKTLVAWVK